MKPRRENLKFREVDSQSYFLADGMLTIDVQGDYNPTILVGWGREQIMEFVKMEVDWIEKYENQKMNQTSVVDTICSFMQAGDDMYPVFQLESQLNEVLKTILQK